MLPLLDLALRRAQERPSTGSVMKRKAETKPSSSSSRAARTGRGQVGLNESAGSLDDLYQTIGVIGRGSFAEINLLKKREGGELFALKTCCKLDALSYAHLRKEAVLMKPLRHAFLLTPVQVVDSRGRAASFSVLLELCPGGDLLQLLRRQPEARLQPAAAARFCAMIVLGLGALHEAGLAYRDLKPENLFLRANGYLRLADFGLAAPLSECDTTQVGTALYQAPELVRKQAHGLGVDWWALGVLLVEMLTGASPFAADGSGDEATQAAVLKHEGGVPSSVAADALPADAALLIAELLRPKAACRLGARAQGGVPAVKAHAWLAQTPWEGLEEMTEPAPLVPPPLDDDTDAALLELTKRCQSGFD